MRREEESKRGKRDHAHAQRCPLTGNGTGGGCYCLCRNGGCVESFECGLCHFGLLLWCRGFTVVCCFTVSVAFMSVSVITEGRVSFK